MGGYGPTWDYAEPEPINPCEGKFDGEPCLGVICKGPRWICPKPICCNGNCQSIHLHQCGWRFSEPIIDQAGSAQNLYVAMETANQYTFTNVDGDSVNQSSTKLDLPKTYMLQWKLPINTPSPMWMEIQ